MMSRSGLIALLLVADEVRHEGCGHELVVAGAASVEITILLGQLERVERPVLGQRLDHVEMGEQQDRLAGPGAAQPRHQIALARRRLEHLHVGVRKPGRAQPRRHGIGRPPGIAGRGDGVDLDQLLVDVDGELLARGPRGHGVRAQGACGAGQGDQRHCRQAKRDEPLHRVFPSRRSDLLDKITLIVYRDATMLDERLRVSVLPTSIGAS